MGDITLELSEAQALTLLRQLSPEGQARLLEVLIAGLDVDLDELGTWDVPEAFLDEEHPWLDSVEEPVEGWSWTDFWGTGPTLTRRQLLAAETYHYSYANYAAHVGGNIRFDELMPEDVDILERCEREGWDDARLARELEVEEERAPIWRRSYERAKAIIDAPTPAEAFRRGVRFSIQNAVDGGLDDEESIEKLVVQMCYRAADLAYLLDMTGLRLSEYSEDLRAGSSICYEPPDLEDLHGW